LRKSFSFFKLRLLSCVSFGLLSCTSIASSSLPSAIDHHRCALPPSHRASTSFFFSSMPLFNNQCNKLVFFSPHFLMPRIFVCGESSLCSCLSRYLVISHLFCKWSKFVMSLLYWMCAASPHGVSWSLLVKFAVGVRCSPWWFVGVGPWWFIGSLWWYVFSLPLRMVTFENVFFFFSVKDIRSVVSELI